MQCEEKASAEATALKPVKKQTTRSDITPDSGGHRPQHPCAQGRTCAKQVTGMLRVDVGELYRNVQK